MKLTVALSIDTGDAPLWKFDDFSAPEFLAWLREQYPSLGKLVVEVCEPPAAWSAVVKLEHGGQAASTLAWSSGPGG